MLLLPSQGSLVMSACPPVLHSYFVLVPNLLHLPNSMLGIGGVSIGVKSLAMFASSKSVGCNYCSLHVYVHRDEYSVPHFKRQHRS
jgi:hypothetical protein